VQRLRALVQRIRLSERYCDALLLFGVALVNFWKLILTGEYSILWSGDNALQAYPWYQFLLNSLHQHSFPFWNPYSEAGRLFIGEPTSGAFYPPNLLLALLPLNSRGLAPAWGLEYLVVIHFFLASWFTYLLARHMGFGRFSSIVAGITFAYSGSLSLRYFAQITVFTASIWIPAAFLCYSKSLRAIGVKSQILWANLGGLALALGLLAGHHQPVLYCGLALAITALVLALSGNVSLWECATSFHSRRRLLESLFLIAAFGGMYASLQLIPSMQYAHEAYRWVGLPEPVKGMRDAPYAIAGTMYGSTPKDLLLLLFPFQGGPETNPYFGILPLFLVVFSLTRFKSSPLCRLMWLLVVFFFLLALGAYTPLHGVLYYLLPGFGKAREASRALVMVHFASAILAAIGCDALFTNSKVEQRTLGRKIIQVFAGLAALTIVIISVTYLHASLTDGTAIKIDFLFISALLLMLTAAIGFYRATVDVRSLQLAVVAVMILDFHGILSTTIKPKSEFNSSGNYEPTQWYRPDTVITFLRSQPGIFRTNFDNKYPRSIGEVDQLDTINGYGATEHQAFADLMRVRGRASDLLNVRFIVTEAALPFQKVFQQGKMKVYENPTCLPRAWLAFRVIEKTSLPEAYAALNDQGLDLRKEALIVGPLSSHLAGLASTPLEGVADSPDPTFARRTPNRFTVDTNPSHPAVLVVSETWYPDWRVKVNGVSAEVLRVDGGLMGVYLEPGARYLEFYLRPSYLYLEVALTAIATMILVWLAGIATSQGEVG
jgi:hypothetical protein